MEWRKIRKSDKNTSNNYRINLSMKKQDERQRLRWTKKTNLFHSLFCCCCCACVRSRTTSLVCIYLHIARFAFETEWNFIASKKNQFIGKTWFPLFQSNSNDAMASNNLFIQFPASNGAVLLLFIVCCFRLPISHKYTIQSDLLIQYRLVICVGILFFSCFAIRSGKLMTNYVKSDFNIAKRNSRRRKNK